MPIRWVHPRLEYGRNYFAVSYFHLICSSRSELLRITQSHFVIPSPESHMLDQVKTGVRARAGHYRATGTQRPADRLVHASMQIPAVMRRDRSHFWTETQRALAGGCWEFRNKHIT